MALLDHAREHLCRHILGLLQFQNAFEDSFMQSALQN